MAYSDKFLRAFKFSVLGWEAVYQTRDSEGKRHPEWYGDPAHVITELVKNDPGGATKFGIDQRDHPSVDVRNLTLETAMEIFHDGTRDLHGHLEGGEWSRIRGDELNDKWAIALFDCTINPGMVSVHWAQEILGLRSDGVIGPKSIAAINGATDKQLRVLLTKRDLYYQTRGSWANSFKKGWAERNNDLRRELGLV